MKGIAYGVGVGPGDPELITVKAVRIIKESSVIAVPGKSAEQSAAYRIAVKSVPELAEKELVPINIPMTSDIAVVKASHKKGAEILKKYLDEGINVVYLTLGDPTIYCSFTYLQRILEADGYKTELVSGITSFCAAAARLNLPLVTGDEQLHIVPAVHNNENHLTGSGTYALMKSANGIKQTVRLVTESGRAAYAVENCGMKAEKVYIGAENIPDDAGYFTIVIAREI